MHLRDILVCGNVSSQPWRFTNRKADIDADRGNCLLLVWFRCSALVSNEPQGVFLTKFILALKLNLCTAISPTRPYRIPQNNMCVNRSACVVFAHRFYVALQELQSGDIAVQPTIVSEIIDDIKKILATYVQKNRSTCKCDRFWVMSRFGI